MGAARISRHGTLAQVQNEGVSLEGDRAPFSEVNGPGSDPARRRAASGQLLNSISFNNLPKKTWRPFGSATGLAGRAQVYCARCAELDEAFAALPREFRTCVISPTPPSDSDNMSRNWIPAPVGASIALLSFTLPFVEK
jgi:hypothetical protein